VLSAICRHDASALLLLDYRDAGELRRHHEVGRGESQQTCGRSAHSVSPEVTLLGDDVEFARPPSAVPDALNAAIDMRRPRAARHTYRRTS
jgi:hypothetical protein